MCLAELEHLVHVGDTVADIGCGSGVLAIASVCLGAASAVGVDTDPEAIAVSRLNAERTDVSARTTFVEGSIEAIAGSRVDILVANIASHVLQLLATQLCAAVNDSGAVVLSGVLAEQVDEVLAAFAVFGFGLVSTAAEDDWRALVLRRTS
jgi:ribosomal protein L11 methyltransferase